jgi:hypothetical protein
MRTASLFAKLAEARLSTAEPPADTAESPPACPAPVADPQQLPFLEPKPNSAIFSPYGALI